MWSPQQLREPLSRRSCREKRGACQRSKSWNTSTLFTESGASTDVLYSRVASIFQRFVIARSHPHFASSTKLGDQARPSPSLSRTRRYQPRWRLCLIPCDPSVFKIRASLSEPDRASVPHSRVESPPQHKTADRPKYCPRKQANWPLSGKLTAFPIREKQIKLGRSDHQQATAAMSRCMGSGKQIHKWIPWTEPS